MSVSFLSNTISTLSAMVQDSKEQGAFFALSGRELIVTKDSSYKPLSSLELAQKVYDLIKQSQVLYFTQKHFQLSSDLVSFLKGREIKNLSPKDQKKYTTIVTNIANAFTSKTNQHSYFLQDSFTNRIEEILAKSSPSEEEKQFLLRALHCLFNARKADILISILYSLQYEMQQDLLEPHQYIKKVQNGATGEVDYQLEFDDNAWDILGPFLLSSGSKTESERERFNVNSLIYNPRALLFIGRIGYTPEFKLKEFSDSLFAALLVGITCRKSEHVHREIESLLPNQNNKEDAPFFMTPPPSLLHVSETLHGLKGESNPLPPLSLYDLSTLYPRLTATLGLYGLPRLVEQHNGFYRSIWEKCQTFSSVGEENPSHTPEEYADLVESKLKKQLDLRFPEGEKIKKIQLEAIKSVEITTLTPSKVATTQPKGINKKKKKKQRQYREEEANSPEISRGVAPPATAQLQTPEPRKRQENPPSQPSFSFTPISFAERVALWRSDANEAWKSYALQDPKAICREKIIFDHLPPQILIDLAVKFGHHYFFYGKKNDLAPSIALYCEVQDEKVYTKKTELLITLSFGSYYKGLPIKESGLKLFHCSYTQSMTGTLPVADYLHTARKEANQIKEGQVPDSSIDLSQFTFSAAEDGSSIKEIQKGVVTIAHPLNGSTVTAYLTQSRNTSWEEIS